MWLRGMQAAEEWRPVMAMLVFDLISAVMTALVKKALEQGLNRLVLITLRQLVATVFLAPIAYFKERKTRPKLTLDIFVYLFFSAVLGAGLAQYTFYYGLQYTTATFAITFANLSPVVTFLIAIALRLESLKMKSKAGAAKLLGTLTSLGGVLLLSLYKGMPLAAAGHHHAVSVSVSASVSGGGSSSSDHRRHGSGGHGTGGDNKQQQYYWMVGTVALLGNCMCFSLWLLLQTKLTAKYPAVYSSTAIMFFLSTLQAGALTLATERLTASAWLLTSKLHIVTVLYSGMVASGVGYLMMAWCVGKKGPVFTAAFIPVIQIMVAIIDLSFLHEQLHLGSVLGSVLMVIGLYLVLWGKKRDAAVPVPSSSSPCTTPAAPKHQEEEAHTTARCQI